MASSVNKQRCKLDIQLIITVVHLIGLVGMVFLQITQTNKESYKITKYVVSKQMKNIGGNCQRFYMDGQKKLHPAKGDNP